ncbi:MAG: polysaccharide deacetylase family protein [Gammaproteobacteria bacterium]
MISTNRAMALVSQLFLIGSGLILISAAPNVFAQEGVPSWQWSEAQWREAVERVRAGRRMLPESWPDDGRVAVALSFDMDAETLLLRDSNTSPSRLSVGQYGPRAGVPRILDMLERYDVPSTFFIPAVSALLYQEQVRAVAEAGHEIGIHGWIHEHTAQLERDDERMLMERSLDTLEELSGRRPVGIRTGSWEYSHNTAELIAEAGLLYDSSLMADDVPFELLSNGEPTGVVELPVEWILDDYPYFGMNRAADIRPYTPPSGVFEIWKREFDMAYEEGGMFLLTMHPQIIGHRSRVSMLEELIQYMRSKPGVWFATHEDIARHAKEFGQ